MSMHSIFHEPVENQENQESKQQSIRKSQGSFFANWIIPLVLFAVGSLFVAWQVMGPKVASAAWINEFDQGLDTSKKSGKPLAALFTADWCPACVSLKNDALSRSDVANMLKLEFTPVKVDLTDQNSPNNRIAQMFGVQSIPTIIIFDTKGRQLDRMSGVVPGDSLLRWIQIQKGRAQSDK
jgi:thiol:disulfide interchange protein